MISFEAKGKIISISADMSCADFHDMQCIVDICTATQDKSTVQA